MNNKIYKLNMNKFTQYVLKVNPNIKNDIEEDTDRLIEVLDTMKHSQPEYMIHVIIPAIQTCLLTWLQCHGYHVDRSGASILTDFGKELIGYANFIMSASFLHELTQEDDHEQEEI